VGSGGRDPGRLVPRTAFEDGVRSEEGRNLLDEAHAALHSRQAWIGTTLPGFTRSWGSNTRRTARMAARDWPSKIAGMYRSLSTPTPCSPVMVPPAAMQAFMISALAAWTRSCSSGLVASKEMLGCR